MNNLQTKWLPPITKRKIINVLMLTIILLSTIWMFNIPASHASKSLEVPQDYLTINEAISHATAGDTILVQSGVYNENIQINKPLTLEGQNKANTVIIGNGDSTPTAVMTLAANNITISGLTIESQVYTNKSNYAYGIWVEGDNCTITGNIIQNTYIGIFCSTQQSTTITQNIITGSMKDGIRFYGGSLNNVSNNNIVGNAVSGVAIDGYSNTISNNNIENNYRGVGLGSSYSILFGNNIQSNSESGIFLAGSQNVIAANNISSNKYGVYVTLQLTAPSANKLFHNNFVDNNYNAYDDSTALIEYWDNGVQSGGNYWSDFQSAPYTINSNNTDSHPLTTLYNLSAPDNLPTAISPIPAKPNSVVALWSFDSVDAGLVAPDIAGDNPAVLGSVTGDYNYTPAMVKGKFGEALGFNGNTYAAVHTSPALETPNDVTIDVWVNVPEIKDVPYNNILIEAVRTTASLPTRSFGLAINGEIPSNMSSPPIGALRAYIMTPSGFNEIDSKEALPLNTWVHVVFVRSTTTGMHIYVNGKEQAVTVAAGTTNPIGPIEKPTNIYIGHDSITEIDQLQISNTVEDFGKPLWLQWWLWVALILAGVAGSGVVFYFKKQIAEKFPERRNQNIRI